MRIENIQILNYRKFKKLDAQLDGKSTIFFGINGTGKSTVLSAINYLFRVWINQLNPSQSKAYETFTDDVIFVGETKLGIEGDIKLGNGQHFKLARFYHKTQKNERGKQETFPRVNYSAFKEKYTQLYLADDNAGMPVFVHYGTNRAVLDIPTHIRNEHHFDKLAAIERVMDKELDFRGFFEWYRDQEANEILEAKHAPNLIYQDPSLACVRHAVEAMIGNVKNLRIKRNPVRMVVDKDGKEIRVDLLSDGEKCTLALFGDLARRLALANPNADNPLAGDGIVLIDEIELHMHPSWQRKILNTLHDVFPNIQFIITTHSPQVLGEADSSYRIISLDADEEGNGLTQIIPGMDGYDSNMILEQYMGTDSSSQRKKKLISEINHAVHDKRYVLAEERLQELAKISGTDDADYITGKEYLRRSKLLNEIHS